MRIAINAISIKQSGSIVALHRLMEEFVALQPDNEYHVIVNESLPGWAQMEHPGVYWYRFPWAEKNFLAGAAWYFVAFPFWMKRRRIDALFSHTCYLPPFAGRHSTMLLQDMNFFVDDPELPDQSLRQRIEYQLKRLWVHSSAGRAVGVLVQSESAARQVLNEIPKVIDRVRVIPHGPGYLKTPPPGEREVTRRKPGDLFQIACVALYRRYKNFQVLLDALRLLKERGVAAILHLTLDERRQEVRELLEQAGVHGVRDRVVNHGELHPGALNELYRKADVFVFPSTRESFGFPQVEAMSFGLPVIAADTAVNREICGFAASFFPPADADHLADLLEELSSNQEMWLQASRMSLRRAEDFNWKRAASDTLAVIAQAAQLA